MAAPRPRFLRDVVFDGVRHRLAPLGMTYVGVLWLAMAACAIPVLAQHHGHEGHAMHDPQAAPPDSVLVPTGLSPDEVTGLLDGRGLGMATPAELNGYPGPLHVLELAEALGLTDDQRATAEALRAAMLEEARPLGEQLVERERALDALFAGGRATEAEVDALTAEIGALRGRLRAAHLLAHLGMRDALTAEQRAAYDRLRGYDE